MYTSDIDPGAGPAARIGFIYLLISRFCALFGAVYEYFSQGVYSYYMLYAFAFPLVGGVLPFAALAMSGGHLPGRLARNLYHSGIAALTVGSILEGVLEIYGTTNQLTAVYWIVGMFFVITGVIRWGMDRIFK